MLVSLRAWLIAAHAFPLMAVMVLTALIALVSADGEPDASRLVALLVAMLASQLATLEPLGADEDGVVIQTTGTPEEIATSAIKSLGLLEARARESDFEQDQTSRPGA